MVLGSGEMQPERPWIQVLFEDWFETCIPASVRQECPSIGFSPISIHSEFVDEAIRTWINKLLAQAGSGLEAHLVNNIPDNLAAGSRMGRACAAACPDIVVWHTPSGTSLAGSQDEMPSVGHSLTAPMAWAWADVPIHIQLQYRGGILQPEDRVGDGLELKAAADHLSQCALECFDRQHRTRLFMVSIIGRAARLVCADRAGIVISAPLDYVEDPTRLGMFFYAYSRMTPEERGFDRTASPATSEEAELFRQLAREADPGSAVGRGLKLAVTPGWRIFALDVYAPWSPPDTFLDAKSTRTRTTHRCLVGRPATTARSVCGRGNREFVAYDTAEKRVVWIKDGWRPMSADIPSEFDNYQTLYGKISRRRLQRGFLTLRAGGDVVCPALPEASESAQDKDVEVGVQTTITHDAMIFSPDGLPPALPLRHTRLVFKEVCRTLEEFSDAVELILAVGGALVAHKYAWAKAGLLHRDVSVGNILIYDSPTGESCRPILAGWDLAQPKENLVAGKQCSAQPGDRSGTWQFQSALLQCCPGKLCEVSDDLESFYHVLNWCTLKYLPYTLPGDFANLTTEGRARRFHELFDRRDTSDLNPKLLFVSAGHLLVGSLPGGD